MSGNGPRKAFALLAVSLMLLGAFVALEGECEDMDAADVYGNAFISTTSSSSGKITGTDTSSGNATKITLPKGYTESYWFFSKQSIDANGPYFNAASGITAAKATGSGTTTISGATWYYQKINVTSTGGNKNANLVVVAQANWLSDNNAAKINFYASNTVKVTFNANGGSVSPASANVTYNEQYGTLPTPTKSGYTFVGWYDNSSLTGSAITSTSTVAAHADHSLYAKWTPTQYTISVEDDGYCTAKVKNNTTGSQGTSVSYVVTDSLTFTASNFSYGYEFGSFGYDKGSSIHIYESLSTSNPWTISGNAIAGKDTIEVQTKEIQQYTLSVAAEHCAVSLRNMTSGNTTTIQSGATGTIAFYNGEKVRMIASADSGYDFSMWQIFTGSIAGWIPQSTNATYTVTLDRTSDAQYKAIATPTPITVTFDANGGTLIGDATKEVVRGQTFGTLPTAQRNNYSFVGWYSDISGVESWITEDAVVTQSSDFTVHAAWSATTVTVTLDANGGTIAGGTSTFTVNYGESITLPNVSKTGYELLYWEHQDIPGQGIQIQQGGTFIPQYSMTLTAVWATPTYAVTLYSNISDTTTVYQTLDGNDNERPITLPNIGRANYRFEGWYTAPTGGTLIGIAGQSYGPTAAISLYAHWTSLVEADWVYWANNLENGRVSILFHYEGTGNYETHKMRIDLNAYTQTNESVTFEDSGYYLDVTLAYYPAVVTVALKDSGNTTISTNTVNVGNWSNYILTFDAINSTIGYTTLTGYTNILSWTEYKDKEILDYSNVVKNLTIPRISHKDTGVGDNVRFSVINTDAYLDTFNVVLVDPTINIYNYFPEYDQIRLNFYSFAIYGDSININGRSYTVTDGKVTIYYVQDQDRNNLVTSQGSGTQSKTMTLSNIYVTWDGENCLWTFVNENFTVNMGSYAPTNLTVSFNGIWYFTTAVWSPYAAQEVHWGLDLSNPLPNVSADAMILIFIGVCIAGLLVASRYVTIHYLDYIVVLVSGAIALLVIGGI